MNKVNAIGSSYESNLSTRTTIQKSIKLKQPSRKRIHVWSNKLTEKKQIDPKSKTAKNVCVYLVSYLSFYHEKAINALYKLP